MSAKQSVLENDLRRRWPYHLDNFTWFLIQCRRYFNGDMDRLLIFCVIRDKDLSAKNKHGDLGHAGSRTEAEKPFSLQSIADRSGLPRETARRKLQDLTALGWVERDERGNFSTTAKAATDLAPLTKISLRTIARMKELQQEKPSTVPLARGSR
jgi:hypothetical protein